MATVAVLIDCPLPKDHGGQCLELTILQEETLQNLKYQIEVASTLVVDVPNSNIAIIRTPIL